MGTKQDAGAGGGGGSTDLLRIELEASVAYLGRARLSTDPIGQSWVSFEVWTPSTGGSTWNTWIHAWVDELGERVVACYDARDDGGELEVVSDVGFDEVEPAVLEELRSGSDLAEVLAAVNAVCAPGLRVAPASEAFLAEVDGDDPGWDAPRAGESDG